MLEVRWCSGERGLAEQRTAGLDHSDLNLARATPRNAERGAWTRGRAWGCAWDAFLFARSVKCRLAHRCPCLAPSANAVSPALMSLPSRPFSA